MPDIKRNISLIFSALALLTSGFSLIQTQSVISNIKAPAHSAPSTHIISQSQVNDEVVSELKSRITNLEAHIKLLSLQETGQISEQSSHKLEDMVFSLIEKHKQQEIDVMHAKDPIYSYFESLPEDYDLRIKTDSEFATQVSNELKQKVLNDNLSAAERLAAISQLQMNMYILNKKSLEQYDYQAVEAVLDMTYNMEDEKLRLQAIELVSRTPVVDERLSQSFTKILEQDPNDYVKSLAAEGLMSQYFQSGSNPKKQKEIAQSLLFLYENTMDQKVKLILQNTMGDERMLDELKTLSKG